MHQDGYKIFAGLNVWQGVGTKAEEVKWGRVVVWLCVDRGAVCIVCVLHVRACPAHMFVPLESLSTFPNLCPELNLPVLLCM